MKNFILKRIALDALVILFIIHGFWYIALPLVLFGLWILPFYYEILFAGVMYDSLFGMNNSLGWRGYAGFFLAVIISGIIFFIRRYLRR
jgi:hypothetical protein